VACLRFGSRRTGASSIPQLRDRLSPISKPDDSVAGICDFLFLATEAGLDHSVAESDPTSVRLSCLAQGGSPVLRRPLLLFTQVLVSSFELFTASCVPHIN
jgi:hypothetical protein